MHAAVIALAAAALLAACGREDAPKPVVPGSANSANVPAGAVPSTPTGPAPSGQSTNRPGGEVRERASQQPGTPSPGTGETGAPVAGGATGEVNKGDKRSALDARDREFLDRVAAGGIAEVQAARTVAERARTPEIKSLAARVAHDQVRAGDTLRRIAADHDLALPTSPQGEAREKLQQLRSMTGPQLERAYLRDFALAHSQANLALFERQAETASDPAVKRFASEQVPVLREHLALASQLKDDRAADGK
jgi:putative membrane protein